MVDHLPLAALPEDGRSAETPGGKFHVFAHGYPPKIWSFSLNAMEEKHPA
jgi:hypothetical protein